MVDEGRPTLISPDSDYYACPQYKGPLMEEMRDPPTQKPFVLFFLFFGGGPLVFDCLHVYYSLCPIHSSNWTKARGILSSGVFNRSNCLNSTSELLEEAPNASFSSNATRYRSPAPLDGTGF